jgi:Ca2+/H+ antiporter
MASRSVLRRWDGWIPPASLVLLLAALLVGGLKHHEQSFRIEGTNTGLATLVAMATLSLVLPTFTTSAPASFYSVPQLVFAAIASLPPT